MIEDPTLKKAIIALAGFVLVIAIVIAGLNSLAPEQSEEKMETIETVSINLSAESVEIGDKVVATAEVSFEDDPEFYDFGWESSNSQVLELTSSTKSNATFLAKAKGEAIIALKVKGMTATKKIVVHPNAFIEIDVDPWIYVGVTTNCTVKSVGVHDLEKKIVDQFGEEIKGLVVSRGEDKLLIKEPGTYDFVVSGKADSDGRLIESVTSFRVGKEVKRGFHQFSFKNEDLLSLHSEDFRSIEIYLKNELGIEVNLESLKVEGNKYSFNSMSTEYLFYKDSDRGDNLCLQEEFSWSQDYDLPPKKIWRRSFKTNNPVDARRWVVGTDGFIVVAFPDSGSYHVLRQSSYDSGNSDYGGGGDEPSPTIPPRPPIPRPPRPPIPSP